MNPRWIFWLACFACAAAFTYFWVRSDGRSGPPRRASWPLPLTGRWLRYLLLFPVWLLIAAFTLCLTLPTHFFGQPGLARARRLAQRSARKAARLSARGRSPSAPASRDVARRLFQGSPRP